MTVRNFKKLFRRKGKFVRQPREQRKSLRQRDEKKRKSDQKCFRCGDPSYLIGDCPKTSHNKDQKAFIRGSWSDSENDAEDKTNDETCLMAQSSNEATLNSSCYSDNTSSLDNDNMQMEYDSLCEISLKIINKNKTLKTKRDLLEKELLELNEKIKKLEKSKEIEMACVGFNNDKASTSGTKTMSFVGSSAEKVTGGSTIKGHGSTLPGSVCLRTCLEPDEWIKDSGCSKHMTGNKSMFSTYKAYDKGIFFNQSKYIKEILKKFGLEDSKPTKTPMSTEIKLTKDDEADSVDSFKYQGRTINPSFYNDLSDDSVAKFTAISFNCLLSLEEKICPRSFDERYKLVLRKMSLIKAKQPKRPPPKRTRNVRKFKRTQLTTSSSTESTPSDNGDLPSTKLSPRSYNRALKDDPNMSKEKMKIRGMFKNLVASNDPYVQTIDNWPLGHSNPSPPPRVSRPPPDFLNPPPRFEPLRSTQPLFVNINNNTPFLHNNAPPLENIHHPPPNLGNQDFLNPPNILDFVHPNDMPQLHNMFCQCCSTIRHEIQMLQNRVNYMFSYIRPTQHFITPTLLSALAA
nr:retrovirus-related Pol polyprotein from transposon TNT 1-94 [Tanacetum cinerariifolium]